MNTVCKIKAAIIASGATTLDAQAHALGVHRSTAWVLMTGRHKLGRLNSGTVRRMLANPHLPSDVRAILGEIENEKTSSAYQPAADHISER